MRQQLVHRLVSYYLKRIGVVKPQMGGHLLRHTAASRMLAAGINIRRVQEYLGHASIQESLKNPTTRAQPRDLAEGGCEVG